MTTLYRVELKCPKTRLWKGICHISIPHPKDKAEYDKLVDEMLVTIPSPDEDRIHDLQKGDLFYFTEQGYHKYLATITSLARKWKARVIKRQVPQKSITIGLSNLQAIIRPETPQTKKEEPHVT